MTKDERATVDEALLWTWRLGFAQGIAAVVFLTIGSIVAGTFFRWINP